MPYPDNYSPAAQDRFMGRNNYAEAFAADCEQAIDQLTRASSMLDDISVLVEEIAGDASAITAAIRAIDDAAEMQRQCVS